MNRLAVAGALTAALVMPMTPSLTSVAHAKPDSGCAPTNWSNYWVEGWWSDRGVALSGRSTTRGRDVTTHVAVLGVGTVKKLNGPTWVKSKKPLTRAPLALVTVKMTGAFARTCSFRLSAG